VRILARATIPTVLLPNPAVDERALGELVRERYGADRCPPFWVSVRRDYLGHDPRAYHAAAELAAGGPEFVLAPLPDHEGRVVHLVGGFPVVVLPLMDGDTLWAGGVRPGDWTRIAGLVGRLHAATCAAPLGHEDYALPFVGELRDGLDAAARAGPHLGPYGGPMRELIARNRAKVEAMLAEIERLATVCRGDSTPLVLTHGEPGTNNVFRDTADRLYLIDWGDLKYGPPERDWTSFKEARPPLRAPFERFYQLRWDLSEIAEYVARFTAPHEGDAEDEWMWRELGLYLH
jgi:spectinomycin phosphotransferase